MNSSGLENFFFFQRFCIQRIDKIQYHQVKIIEKP